MKKHTTLLLSLLMIAAFLIQPALRPGVSAQSPLPTGQGNDADPGVLIVGYRQSAGPRVLSLPETASIAGDTGELQKLNAVKIQVRAGQEEQVKQDLLQDPDVLFVELDSKVHANQLIPNDPLWPQQYGPPAINMPQAWETISTMTLNSTVLAILDSGLDTGHPEFTGRLVSGYDFVQNDTVPQDECGHGTHVTGIAAATGNNAAGIAGINWQVKIMPVRVLDKDCSGYFSSIAKGMVFAVDHGAKVVNLSLGSASPSSLMENAMYYAYSHGVAVFAAAGNEGGTSIDYPANYPWVMAVGATDQSNQRASYSNTTKKINQMLVMAPGDNIISTAPRGEFTYKYTQGLTPNYGYLSGTSMAAPHVSGAAALLAALPLFDTPDKIYQALYRTADGSIGPQPGWDGQTGYGLIDVEKALHFTQFEPPPPQTGSDIVYDYVSSNSCGNLPFQWVDATDGKFILMYNNDALQPVSFQNGKTFRYGGVDYSSLEISANGYLIFGRDPKKPYTDYPNDPIPSISQPNNFIAPLWADLSSYSTMLIYAKQEADRFIVEWKQVSFQGYSSAQSELTFEVILYFGSGDVLFQYQTLRGVYADGSIGTVGVEYGDGTTGTQYSYNRKGSLQPGLAILFSPAQVGSTRQLAGCLFVTQTEFQGCSQLAPFGVDIFDGLLPPPPPATTLQIQLLKKGPSNIPNDYLSLNHFARITLDPSPATPFNPKPLVCYQYTLADILKAGGHAANMFIGTYNSGSRTWMKLPTVVDQSAQMLTAPASHFSDFGVFSDQPTQLPVTGAPVDPSILFLLASVAVILAGLTVFRINVKK